MASSTFEYFDESSKIDFEPDAPQTDNDCAQKRFSFNMPLFAVSFIGDGNLVVGGGGGSNNSGLKSGIFCLSTKNETRQRENGEKSPLLWAIDLRNSVPLKTTYLPSQNKLIFSRENDIFFSKMKPNEKSLRCECLKTTNKEFSTKKFVFGPMKANPKNIAIVSAENVAQIFRYSDLGNSFALEGSIVSAKKITEIDWQPGGPLILISTNADYFSLYNSSPPHEELSRSPRFEKEMKIVSALFQSKNKIVFIANKGEPNKQSKNCALFAGTGNVALFDESGFDHRSESSGFEKHATLLKKGVTATSMALAGEVAAAALGDGGVIIFCVKRLCVLYEYKKLHQLPITAMCFDAQNQWLATVGADGMVTLHNVKLNLKRRTIKRRKITFISAAVLVLLVAVAIDYNRPGSVLTFLKRVLGEKSH